MLTAHDTPNIVCLVAALTWICQDGTKLWNEENMIFDERGHVLLRPNGLRISRREREYHVPKSLESRARSGRLDARVGSPCLVIESEVLRQYFGNFALGVIYRAVEQDPC